MQCGRFPTVLNIHLIPHDNCMIAPTRHKTVLRPRHKHYVVDDSPHMRLLLQETYSIFLYGEKQQLSMHDTVVHIYIHTKLNNAYLHRLYSNLKWKFGNPLHLHYRHKIYCFHVGAKLYLLAIFVVGWRDNWYRSVKRRLIFISVQHNRNYRKRFVNSSIQ